LIRAKISLVALERYGIKALPVCSGVIFDKALKWLLIISQAGNMEIV
jgi:hypothetical protein